MQKLNELGFIRVAAVSPEVKVADIEFNKNEIIEQLTIANKKQCQLVLFPELAVTSYTCADLFFQNTLLQKSLAAIEEIALFTEKLGCIVILGSPLVANNMLFNCAFVMANGEIKGIVPKTYIPNTNEFYEKRWFSSEFDRISDEFSLENKRIPFGADLCFSIENIPSLKFGVEICEDLWAVEPPSTHLSLTGSNLILNLSASNEVLGKHQYRKQLVISQSARTLSAYVYASSGAGESSTDLCFSGSLLIAENGILLNEGKRFNFNSKMEIADIDFEKLNSERLKNSSFASAPRNKLFREVSIKLKLRKKVDTSDRIISSQNKIKLYRKVSPTPFIPQESDRAAVCKEIFNIQTTALAKRIKHTQSKSIVLGVSGGLDSTLALIVAFKTFELLGLDKKNLIAVTMPGMGTSKRTKSNAEKLSNLLGVNLLVIPIEKAVKQHFEDIGHNPEQKDIVYENAQARERTQILMDLSNKYNGFVLGTGDLSELALGWCTYNGDHISMYGVNSGIPKTLIKYIIEWAAHEEFEKSIANILLDIIETPISPELLPTENGEIVQKTEKEIGDYILNDFFLYYFFRFGFSPEKIQFLAEIAFENKYKTSEIKNWLVQFYKRFFTQQFKRSCLPDGVKIGSVSLSPRGDWRMPSDATFNEWL
ncbi:MAG TPA: NAD(+) synthase [Candidatus Kapabacteria bacterium]|nr:NAD(+) synthase [Candidatus Kapabacteria bacterium]HPO64027.1 NAD(+) synthase [Candidatus Kapabacteria bacterium]